MADLLECLVQIRALAETPRRATELLRRFPPVAWGWRPSPAVWSPVEVLAHLADAELFYGTRLRSMLTIERPPLPLFDQAALAERADYRSWPPELALARLITRRGETCELLGRCGAAELERTGVHPGGGVLTVADLVAVMLAHDTDHLGQIRERLEAAAGEGKTGARGPGSGTAKPDLVDLPNQLEVGSRAGPTGDRARRNAGDSGGGDGA